MDTNEIISSMVLELRRGTLILLTLSRLQTPQYGYNLVKRLQDGGIPMEAGTLYPLLRRLEGQGLLQSQWETDGAKPRKYYVITQEGRNVLSAVKEHWHTLSQNVEQLLQEEVQDA